MASTAAGWCHRSAPVDYPRDQFVTCWQEMTVGVDRCGDRLVAEPGLDVWQRSPAGDQPRDMGVPQIMEPERRYVFRRHRAHKLPPYVGVEVAVVQRKTGAAGEHEVVSRSALNPLLEQC